MTLVEGGCQNDIFVGFRNPFGCAGYDKEGVYFHLSDCAGVDICFSTAHSEDAQALIDAAVEYYRGSASVATVEMTIHRPAWERAMTIKAWTKGIKNSLFTVVAPPKDEGNSTLKRGTEMWTYNPKVNRVIKLPPSLMSQSWMGSDFSNNDLAKSDTILNGLHPHPIAAPRPGREQGVRDQVACPNRCPGGLGHADPRRSAKTISCWRRRFTTRI